MGIEKCCFCETENVVIELSSDRPHQKKMGFICDCCGATNIRSVVRSSGPLMTPVDPTLYARPIFPSFFALSSLFLFDTINYVRNWFRDWDKEQFEHARRELENSRTKSTAVVKEEEVVIKGRFPELNDND